MISWRSKVGIVLRVTVHDVDIDEVQNVATPPPLQPFSPGAPGRTKKPGESFKRELARTEENGGAEWKELADRCLESITPLI
jgi:hypothetical protein